MLFRALQGLSNALPSQCAVCHAWPAEPVCKACVRRFAEPRLRCGRCALVLHTREVQANAGAGTEPSAPAGITCAPLLCHSCTRRPPSLAECFAAVDYGYPWAGRIAALKFGDQPGWAGALAALLLESPGVRDAIGRCEHAVPMPLSPARLRERGFNQALAIARHMAPGRAEAGWLLRIRDTPAQRTLDRAARLANVRGAFAVDPLAVQRIAGRRIALVDDVMTSGASMEEAARQLLAAGAASVSGFVIARTEEG